MNYNTTNNDDINTLNDYENEKDINYYKYYYNPENEHSKLFVRFSFKCKCCGCEKPHILYSTIV